MMERQSQRVQEFVTVRPQMLIVYGLLSLLAPTSCMALMYYWTSLHAHVRESLNAGNNCMCTGEYSIILMRRDGDCSQDRCKNKTNSRYVEVPFLIILPLSHLIITRDENGGKIGVWPVLFKKLN